MIVSFHSDYWRKFSVNPCQICSICVFRVRLKKGTLIRRIQRINTETTFTHRSVRAKHFCPSTLRHLCKLCYQCAIFLSRTFNTLAMQKLQEKLQEAKAWIQSHITTHENTIALTLGSGLGNFAGHVENPIAIDTKAIPYFPTPSVAGHHGKLIFGTIKSKPVVLLKGRVHLYEGRSVEEVTFYVRLLNMLGIKSLILTNAAGGVNPLFEAGELCLIVDVINLMFTPNSDASTFFVAHEPLFDKELQQVARDSACACGILLREGVYAGVLGPSYETRAEIRMLQTLRADLVGMSTVLEAITAKQLGMRVLGISLVTNKAAGLANEVLSHDEVQAVAQRAQKEFSTLIEHIVTKATTN